MAAFLVRIETPGSGADVNERAAIQASLLAVVAEVSNGGKVQGQVMARGVTTEFSYCAIEKQEGSTMEATIWDKTTGKPRTVNILEANRLVGGGGWTHTAPLPAGWDRETPRYRASQDLLPAALPRHMSEKPFTEQDASNRWQYSDREIRAGEIIETRSWPHTSMQPENEIARQIREFFTTRQRSRMNASPFINGRLALEDGLTFGAVTVANHGYAPAPQPIRAPSRGARSRVA